ncbi:hypothetical protein IVR12_02351 (plasmid) [Limosilactobacillus reuteri]|nr:hypothetical protein IVR12_02351 [Limosilactobacillus reuteri]
MRELTIDIIYINTLNNNSFASLDSRKRIKKLQHQLGQYMLSQISYKKGYSISHSHMCVALASYVNRVGIDIELINKTKKARIQFLSKSEKQLVNRYGFTRIWTLKEAIAKYHTVGLPRLNTVEIKEINASNVIYFVNKAPRKLQYKFLDIIPSYRLSVVAKKVSSFCIRITQEEDLKGLIRRM